MTNDTSVYGMKNNAPYACSINSSLRLLRVIYIEIKRTPLPTHASKICYSSSTNVFFHHSGEANNLVFADLFGETRLCSTSSSLFWLGSSYILFWISQQHTEYVSSPHSRLTCWSSKSDLAFLVCVGPRFLHAIVGIFCASEHVSVRVTCVHIAQASHMCKHREWSYIVRAFESSHITEA